MVLKKIFCTRCSNKAALMVLTVLALVVSFSFARAGGTDGVPDPWGPVSVQQSEVGVEVGVWGRSYSFFNAALPTSVRTGDKELLAAPVRLAGLVNARPIVWRPGGNLVLSKDNTQATVSGWQSSDEVVVNTSTRIEFDGMVCIGVTVAPLHRKMPRLEQLWLEIPLKRELVKLFHYYPGTWGNAANSGAVTDSGLDLPFKPFVWLGDETGGLSWFAESDQGWQPETNDRVIELVPQGEVMLLRLRLSDSEKKLPATFTIGLQATPVKQWPVDFHEKRIWHASELGVGVTMPVPKEWWLCHRAFPDHQPLQKLDRARQLGVKTVVFHEDWVPIQNYPVTYPEADFKSIVDACHRCGMKVLVYQGYELSPLAPEWPALHDEVLVKNEKGEFVSYWFRPPDQRDYKVCYKSVWRDRLADHIEKAMGRYGFDGLYLDSTIMPAPCCNERHGCGYRDADGKLHPTYPIFGVRAFMQRLYKMVHARGGMINAHQSTCCVTPTLAFTDGYWDGEQLTSGSNANAPLAALSLETFRAEFMGRNYGVPCEFLAYERPPHWTIEHALAVSMLHDVRVRPCGLAALERISPIWDVMTRFGITEAEWHPYWEVQPAATAQPDSVKVSAYTLKPPLMKKGRALLVVSNLSPSNSVKAEVALDAAHLGVSPKKIFDALSRENLVYINGQLLFSIEPMRMRLIWVE
ncbi:MAG: hypothetical protein A2283_10940 [Lentisphaerae bacterium RIFOXYA12_FULL_48_11]|nr:MAG: hypothetical protein A2283_10940 [Lentisphaerae bacterium RIFOXYA12_FULL_48_11]